MHIFWQHKFKENAQKQYLRQKEYSLFYSDYFDILAIILFFSLVGIMIKVKMSIIEAIIACTLYGLIIGVIKIKLHKWQRKKLAKLVNYEKTQDKWQNYCKNVPLEELHREVRRILAEIKNTALDEFFNEGKYDLVVVFSEDDLKKVLSNHQNYEKTVIVSEHFSTKSRRLIKNELCGQIVLATLQDIFALAVKEKIITLPKDNLDDMVNEDTPQKHIFVLQSGYVLGGGLGCLLLANFSRYFYVYFLAGIFLLSIYWLSMKKSQRNELLLLKKTLKSAKIK